MTARVLDGTAVAGQIREELRPGSRCSRPCRTAAGLGIVLVGDESGLARLRQEQDRGRAWTSAMPSTSSTCPRRPRFADVLAVVRRLNRSATHDGILVQSPLPAAMGDAAERTVFGHESTRPRTSTGFSPVNVGYLVQNGRRSRPARRRASSSCSTGPASRSPAGTPSSSAAVTSSASRWR